MSTIMRFIHTGPLSARRNMAITVALTELHRAGQIPDTLRFYRCPPSVLVGRDQRLADAVHVKACLRQHIEITRRATGGGAVYMDHDTLAWEVIAERHRFGERLGDIGERIRSGIAAGLSRFGLPARVRPPNEVAVDGRRISESNGCVDGPTALFQGMVRVDVDLAAMAAFLRRSAHHRHGNISACPAPRVTSIAEWLGRKPSPDELKGCLLAGIAHQWNCSFVRAAPTQLEGVLADRWFDEDRETAVPSDLQVILATGPAFQQGSAAAAGSPRTP